MFGAIRSDDSSRVSAVLEQNPDVRAHLDEGDPEFHFGATPLLFAVGRRNREIVDVLLRAGADMNARSNWWAGSFGVLDSAEPEFSEFLIARGATVDAHAAARLGMFERLRELVDANPESVHARGGDGQTPLHFASTVEIAAFLVDRGADPDTRDIDHESTPAQYMVRDRQEVARYLIGRGCRTDLLLAAALGEMDLVVRHLEADPASVRMSVSREHFPMQNPRAGGSIYIWTLGANKTAHMVAREFGHEDIYRLLMDRSPAELKLAMACEMGEEEAVERLRVAIVDEIGRLPAAAQRNNTNAVRLMLGAGWPVDARGQHLATALRLGRFPRESRDGAAADPTRRRYRSQGQRVGRFAARVCDPWVRA